MPHLWQVMLSACLLSPHRYSFRVPPQLELKVRPKLGEREVTFLHVTEWIEKKLKHEFQVPGLLFRASASPAEPWALLPLGRVTLSSGQLFLQKASTGLVWPAWSSEDTEPK